jgi:hypothetical protein
LAKPGNPSELKASYYTGVLSPCGSWQREQAYRRGLGFVDLWSPLNDLTKTGDAASAVQVAGSGGDYPRVSQQTTSTTP